MAMDNNTSTNVYTITDNTSVAGSTYLSPTLTVSAPTRIAATTADSLAIDADSNGVPYLAIDNASGGAHLYRTTSLTPLKSASSGMGLLSIFGPIDIAVSADNKKVGVAGVSAASGTTYPAFRIWYDE